MEIKPTFEVKSEGAEIVFIQTVEKRMSVQESMSEINVMKSEVNKLKQQLDSMQTAKKEDMLGKDIAKLAVQVERLNKAYADWGELIGPEMERLDKEIRRKVKKSKVKMGYDRIKDVNAKIVRQNEILAPICEETGVDVISPMIRKIKVEFDRI